MEYRKVKKLSEYFLQIKLMNTIFIQKLPEFISEHPLKRYLSTSLEHAHPMYKSIQYWNCFLELKHGMRRKKTEQRIVDFIKEVLKVKIRQLSYCLWRPGHISSCLTKFSEVAISKDFFPNITNIHKGLCKTMHEYN